MIRHLATSSKIEATSFFMAAAKSENKPHECHKYSCIRDNLPHHHTTFQFTLRASAVKKIKKKAPIITQLYYLCSKEKHRIYV
jgi:hypothetical protein